jgi:hypothetical protein
MSVILIDIFCVILIATGIGLAVKGARAPRGHARSLGRPGEPPRPAAYASRIVGVMLTAFGAALGVMVTAFSIALG